VQLTLPWIGIEILNLKTMNSPYVENDDVERPREYGKWRFPIVWNMIPRSYFDDRSTRDLFRWINLSFSVSGTRSLTLTWYRYMTDKPLTEYKSNESARLETRRYQPRGYSLRRKQRQVPEKQCRKGRYSVGNLGINVDRHFRLFCIYNFGNVDA